MIALTARLLGAPFVWPASELRLLITIVDVRHGPTQDDLDMLGYARGRWPVLILANKADKLRSAQRAEAVRTLREALGTSEFLLFSAETGEGRDSLRAAIQKTL